MKTAPFDLQAALNGAKVVTRDGVRVLKVWRNNEVHETSNVAVSAKLGDDETFSYYLDGSYTRNGNRAIDLFLLDESEDEPTPPVAAAHDDLQYRIALRILSELNPDADRSYNEALMRAAEIVREFE